MQTFNPLLVAARAIRLARAGGQLFFDDGPVGDIERDALVAGLPEWLAAKSGNLYLAANASWPGLFKIGCTRRSVPARMQQLSGAGVATPWVAVQAWSVHDAHGLEAAVHRACADCRVTGELFHAPAETLVQTIDDLIALDHARIQRVLSIYLPASFERVVGGTPCSSLPESP